eukprot:g3396.t1
MTSITSTANDKGAEYFSKGKYELALKAYSEAIDNEKAGVAVSISISKAYANRALCWILLNRCQEAIADCDVCISSLTNEKTKNASQKLILKCRYRRMFANLELHGEAALKEDALALRKKKVEHSSLVFLSDLYKFHASTQKPLYTKWLKKLLGENGTVSERFRCLGKSTTISQLRGFLHTDAEQPEEEVLDRVIWNKQKTAHRDIEKTISRAVLLLFTSKESGKRKSIFLDPLFWDNINITLERMHSIFRNLHLSYPLLVIIKNFSLGTQLAKLLAEQCATALDSRSWSMIKHHKNLIGNNQEMELAQVWLSLIATLARYECCRLRLLELELLDVLVRIMQNSSSSNGTALLYCCEAISVYAHYKPTDIVSLFGSSSSKSSMLNMVLLLSVEENFELIGNTCLLLAECCKASSLWRDSLFVGVLRNVTMKVVSKIFKDMKYSLCNNYTILAKNFAYALLWLAKHQLVQNYLEEKHAFGMIVQLNLPTDS